MDENGVSLSTNTPGSMLPLGANLSFMVQIVIYP